MSKALLTFAFLLVSTFGFSQADGWHSTLAKKDNQIMATTALPPNQAFKVIHQYLIENNYNIEKADSSTLYITATSVLTQGLGSGQYRLNIYLKAEDSTRAYFQGSFNAAYGGVTMPSMASTSIIENTGMKGSTKGSSFAALNSAAHSIPNATIRYRKKPNQ